MLDEALLIELEIKGASSSEQASALRVSVIKRETNIFLLNMRCSSR
jgi:hypothetical protein